MPRASALRYQQQRSVPQIHQQLQQRGVCISQRNVSHLLLRYDELLALELSDLQRWQNIVRGQKQVILAIDGMPPEVGHEVLWVLRDCLSQEILLARTMLSATNQDACPFANRGETGILESQLWE